MTMDDVYAEMKMALRYFGLTFDKMSEVSCRVEGGSLIFSYETREIFIRIAA